MNDLDDKIRILKNLIDWNNDRGFYTKDLQENLDNLLKQKEMMCKDE